MLDIMNEVDNRLDTSSFELNDSTVDEMTRLKSEFKDVSQKRSEATDKLKESQSRLKFLTEVSEQLRQKNTRVDKEVKELTCILSELETKDRQLKDEKLLDSEIDELKNNISLIENEMAPSRIKRDALGVELDSLAATKTTLNKELLTASVKLNDVRNELPVLKNKKDEAGKRMQLCKELLQKYDEVKEVHDNLNGEKEELEFEAQKSAPGIRLAHWGKGSTR